MLVENLATLGNTELNVISDFVLPDQTNLMEKLNQVPLALLKFEHLLFKF